MLKPFTQTQQRSIINNVLSACRDTAKLNAAGYNFISGCNGFIAYYNRTGFIDYYAPGELAQEILSNARFNKYSNFRSGEQNAEYYHSKRDIYNSIVEGLTDA